MMLVALALQLLALLCLCRASSSSSGSRSHILPCFQPSHHISPGALLVTPYYHEAILGVNEGELVKLCYDPEDRPQTLLIIADFLQHFHVVDPTNQTFGVLMNSALARNNRPYEADCSYVSSLPLSHRLLPYASTELIAGFSHSRLEAARGESSHDASRRTCENLRASHALKPEFLPACIEEGARKINASRGLKHLIPHSYSYERQLLECDVFRLEPGEEGGREYVEGGTVFYPFKFPALQSLLEVLLINRNPLSPLQVCEVGFNLGHSSLFWLLFSPSVNVRAFDLGEHSYSHRSSSYLFSRFGPSRFAAGVTFGDSRSTLPSHLSAVLSGDLPPCDVVFIDGGHSFDVATSDIANLRGAVSLDHILIIDDVNQDEVERAWKWALDEGLVEEHGEIFEDNFFVEARKARSAMVYGVYTKEEKKAAAKPVSTLTTEL